MSEINMRLAIADATQEYDALRIRVEQGLASSSSARSAYTRVRAAIRALADYRTSNDPPRIEDLPAPPRFVLDGAAIAVRLADRDDDDLPTIGIDGHPSRDIENLWSEFEDCIESEWAVVMYPLIYDGDSDGMLITISKDIAHAGLCGWSLEWNDLCPRGYTDQPLTPVMVTQILQNIVDEANRVSEREVTT